jgi:pyruvate-ferredoxin/flavodoxin oxidoreductase
LIANATGCSSIYGGNLPTTPWTARTRTAAGPTWANSLFEDNAEFGLGLRLAVEQRTQDWPRELLRQLAAAIVGADLRRRACRAPTSRREAGIAAQRGRVAGAASELLRREPTPPTPGGC